MWGKHEMELEKRKCNFKFHKQESATVSEIRILKGRRCVVGFRIGLLLVPLDLWKVKMNGIVFCKI